MMKHTLAAAIITALLVGAFGLQARDATAKKSEQKEKK